MRPLTAKYAVTQNDWMMDSAHPVSFIMKNILAGFENSGLWSFSRNTFSYEDFKAAPAVCGGNNEPSVLTPRSVG